MPRKKRPNKMSTGMPGNVHAGRAWLKAENKLKRDAKRRGKKW